MLRNASMLISMLRNFNPRYLKTDTSVIGPLYFQTAHMWSLTTSRSTIRDNIGVTGIRLRSTTEVIGVHFGTGVITDVRQAAGTTPCPTDILPMPYKFTGAVAKDPVGYIIIFRFCLSQYSLYTVFSVINMAKRVVWSRLSCLYNLITIVIWISFNTGKIIINLIWVKIYKLVSVCPSYQFV